MLITHPTEGFDRTWGGGGSGRTRWPLLKKKTTMEQTSYVRRACLFSRTLAFFANVLFCLKIWSWLPVLFELVAREVLIMWCRNHNEFILHGRHNLSCEGDKEMPSNASAWFALCSNYQGPLQCCPSVQHWFEGSADILWRSDLVIAHFLCSCRLLLLVT